MKSSINLVISLGALVFVTGCGSSGSGPSSILNPPPVQAQSTYSNASLSGTYSVSLVRGEVESDFGSFKADGNGNITSGTLTLSESGVSQTCSETFTGTYAINSDATGTATITTTPTCPIGLGVNGAKYAYNLQLGQQGSIVLLSPSPTNADWVPGTAVKQ